MWIDSDDLLVRGCGEKNLIKTDMSGMIGSMGIDWDEQRSTRN